MSDTEQLLTYEERKQQKRDEALRRRAARREMALTNAKARQQGRSPKDMYPTPLPGSIVERGGTRYRVAKDGSFRKVKEEGQ